MERKRDLIFFVYFLTHIPFTLFVDMQAIFPRWMFPEPAVELVQWYARVIPDPFTAEPKPWIQAFFCSEFFFQLPCFFIGVYVFYYGVEKNKWCRIPLMLYGCHTATTTWATSWETLLGDFKDYHCVIPKTMTQRYILLAIYSPYFVIPLALVFDAVFSKCYQPNSTLQYTSYKNKFR